MRGLYFIEMKIVFIFRFYIGILSGMRGQNDKIIEESSNYLRHLKKNL